MAKKKKERAPAGAAAAGAGAAAMARLTAGRGGRVPDAKRERARRACRGKAPREAD